MNPEIQTILNTLLLSLITALVGIVMWALPKIIALIKDYIQAKINLLESNMNASDRVIFNDIVTKAVQDAQQRSEIRDILNTATAKKDYALKAIQQELTKLGIPFDVAAADRAIEAAINQNVEHPAPQLIKGEAINLKPFAQNISSVASNKGS